MTILGAIVGGLLAVASGAPPPEPRPLFELATPTGLAASTWASLAYDRQHDELFAVYDGFVHVFNVAGMETFRFGGDSEAGAVQRVAILENGEFLLLSSLDGRPAIVRCDFRGERLGRLELKPLPEGFADFRPDRILVQGGKVHLVESQRMRVVVADEQGAVEKTHDLASAIRAVEPQARLGMNGFWVDAQGTMYATLPYSFTTFVLTPGQPPRQFGTRGSSPGKFNIVGAITTDEKGTIFVLDRLRSVVMVFTPELKFVLEFGYRGDGPENLTAPFDIAVGNGKIFVSQARSRGVKAFEYDPAWKPALTDGPKP